MNTRLQKVLLRKRSAARSVSRSILIPFDLVSATAPVTLIQNCCVKPNRKTERSSVLVSPFVLPTLNHRGSQKASHSFPHSYRAALRPTLSIFWPWFDILPLLVTIYLIAHTGSSYDDEGAPLNLPASFPPLPYSPWPVSLTSIPTPGEHLVISRGMVICPARA